MKEFSFKAVFVLLLICFASLISVPAICNQYLDQIQSKIENLERKESGYESVISYLKETLNLLQSGNYIIASPAGLDDHYMVHPTPKNLYDEWISIRVLTGKITTNEARDRTARAGAFTREMITKLPGEISSLERALEKIKNELISLLDERARLRESGARGNQLGGDGSRPIANEPRSGNVISGPFGTYQTLHSHVGCTKPNSACNDGKPYNIRLTIAKRSDGKIQADLDPPSITLVGDLNGLDYVFTYNGYGRGRFQFSPDFSSFTGTFEDDNGHRGTWTGKK
jgi:hypothetical protein